MSDHKASNRHDENEYRASLTPRQREILDELVARALGDHVVPWYLEHPEALEELRKAREAEKGEAA